MTSTHGFQFQPHILRLEEQGLVTRTFRRLDPQRQQAVIAAILEEAIERGPTQINIKHVAERAQVSVGSLYQYFGNRENLLSFAVELCVRSVSDSFAQYRDALAAMPLRDALAAYISEGMKWGKEQAALTQFFARAAYQGETPLSKTVVRPIADVMRDMIHAVLTQAAARGETRADVDLGATTRVIHALMIAIGDSQLLPYLNHYFQVTDKKMPAQRVTEAMVDMILNGISSAKK